MDSFSTSRTQRSNIRKARKRDPIVSVFMHDNPSLCYSISVPASKSWSDFSCKVQKQFHLPSTSLLIFYRHSIPDSDDESDTTHTIDLTQLTKHDTAREADMSRIKHNHTFCVESTSIPTSTANPNNSSSESSSSTDDETLTKSEQKMSADPSRGLLSVSERAFGLDIDIFDRLCTSKKPLNSKNKASYHFHPPSVMHSLNFHFKSTWLRLKQQTLSVRHVDDHYTLLTSQDSQQDANITLRSRRLIWPRNLEHNTGSFEYKLSDMKSCWKWVIIMVHGGKFAAAVYHGGEMVAHKTLRRYVVRKKQGKRQANHLASSGVKGGSAGGYKRAWNEKKLMQEIHEILAEWMDHLCTCHKVFVHCPGVINKTSLFGSSEEQNQLYPQKDGELNEELSKIRLEEVKNKNKSGNQNLFRLNKKDERIVQIPISTHKVTLSEVERVHYWLSTCWLSATEMQDVD